MLSPRANASGFLENLSGTKDHRFVKKITKPMRGFKPLLHRAKATLAGIQLHHMLRKSEHNSRLTRLFLNSFMDSLHSCV